ncbi:MAG: hypothetical protein WKF83_14320 [Nocardioidaceae bacterium]
MKVYVDGEVQTGDPALLNLADEQQSPWSTAISRSTPPTAMTSAAFSRPSTITNTA